MNKNSFRLTAQQHNAHEERSANHGRLLQVERPTWSTKAGARIANGQPWEHKCKQQTFLCAKLHKMTNSVAPRIVRKNAAATHNKPDCHTCDVVCVSALCVTTEDVRQRESKYRHTSFSVGVNHRGLHELRTESATRRID